MDDYTSGGRTTLTGCLLTISSQTSQREMSELSTCDLRFIHTPSYRDGIKMVQVYCHDSLCKKDQCRSSAWLAAVFPSVRFHLSVPLACYFASGSIRLQGGLEWYFALPMLPPSNSLWFSPPSLDVHHVSVSFPLHLSLIHI